MREYLETLLRGMQIQIESELSGLTEKLGSHMAQQTREHVEVIRRLSAVESKVDKLESFRDEEGGREVQRNRDVGIARWIATWLPSLLAVLIAGYVAFGPN